MIVQTKMKKRRNFTNPASVCLSLLTAYFLYFFLSPINITKPVPKIQTAAGRGVGGGGGGGGGLSDGIFGGSYPGGGDIDGGAGIEGLPPEVAKGAICSCAGSVSVCIGCGDNGDKGLLGATVNCDGPAAGSASNSLIGL